MTLDTIERSTHDGTPVEFFEFTYGSVSWHWTNAETALSLLSFAWLPTQISRSNLKETDERSSRDLTVFVPRDNPLAAALLAGTIGMDVQVRIYVSHRTIVGGDLVWQGQVSGVSAQGSQAQILCRGINAFTDRPVPRLAISRTCPLMLYEPLCGVVRSTYTHAATVVSIVGRDVTVSGAPNLDSGEPDFDATYYVAGTLQMGNDIGFIEAQDEDVLTLMNAVSLSPGDAVQLSAGCDRTFTTCRARFANSNRFLGFPFLPLKNPFEGRFD
jgi:hypothetical protein